MVSPADGGSRIGIVPNGSPLFTGGAGSGESEIRKWVIENDYLEAIVALPTDMFYGMCQEILRSLAKALSFLRDTIETNRKAVSLLQERRAALISAAVTGRIDVRKM